MGLLKQKSNYLLRIRRALSDSDYPVYDIIDYQLSRSTEFTKPSRLYYAAKDNE